MAIKAGPRGRPAINLIDPASLDDVTKDALRERARKAVAEEQQQKTADALYLQYLDEERKALDPVYEMKYIQLDMAGHSDRIMLDGTIFFHGITYEVPMPVYLSLREVVQNGWKHEREISGSPNARSYNRPRDTHISQSGVRHLGGGVAR